MQLSNIITISVGDPLYPPIFLQLKRPPATIYALGNIHLLEEARLAKSVSIVGTRLVTPYGKEVTVQLGKAAAQHGLTVISGLAHGIDTVAHKAALEVGGHTIAVLPAGIENVYPRTNYRLAEEIVAQNGLLISEYAGPDPPMKFQFVERNRLVAALGQVILVTEAAHKSGTFHTVEYGQAIGKKIVFVPGNITSQQSTGVNKHIRDGGEPILENQDLLSIFGINEKVMKSEYRAKNAEEHVLIELLTEGPIQTNTLFKESKLAINVFQSQLTMLEIKGVIRRNQTGWWQLA